MTTTADFTVEELPIPPNVDVPMAADFVEMVGVRNAVEFVTLGCEALAYSAAELLPVYRTQQYEPKRIFVARMRRGTSERTGGPIVGRAILSWSIAQNTSSSWVAAEVLPDHRDRRIGSALFALVEDLAGRSGRPSLQVEALHSAAAGGERVRSPTGYGALPTADPGVRFLTRRGYRLEQVARVSFLDLPVDWSSLAELDRRAADAAGADYTVVSWTGRTPREWMGDLANLRTRMSTDAPSAGLDMDEEPWDDARVASHDDALAAGRRTTLTVGAKHLPSGRLIGFSELSVPDDTARAVQQLDTLVISAHRGHRLGTLLKIANLRRLSAFSPASGLAYTFNAEENRHMLDVNESIGFRAVGYEGAWRKQR